MNRLKWGWERGREGEASEEVTAVRDDSDSAPAVAVEVSKAIRFGQARDLMVNGLGEGTSRPTIPVFVLPGGMELSFPEAGASWRTGATEVKNPLGRGKLKTIVISPGEV